MKMVKKRISLKVHDKKKKKKVKTTRRKDEENILSKDIDIEEEMKDIETKMDDKPSSKTSNLRFQSQNFIRNLKFKPQKYKGNFLPYHLRWILNNPIVSIHITIENKRISFTPRNRGIRGIKYFKLKHEINRLKQKKLLNREHRRISNLPCKN